MLYLQPHLPEMNQAVLAFYMKILWLVNRLILFIIIETVIDKLNHLFWSLYEFTKYTSQNALRGIIWYTLYQDNITTNREDQSHPNDIY